MVKKAKITGAQLILMLVITRVLFSSCSIPAINPGTSIQDILPALVVSLLLNLIVAVPILMLLRRHPGRDLIECSLQILGRFTGTVVAIIYLVFFVFMSAAYLGVYQCYFHTSIISEASPLPLILPMMIVSVYAVIQGIEPIARFGLLIFIFYIVVSVTIYMPILPDAEYHNLMPLFYNGFGYFKSAVLSNFIMSPQILLLAICAPYLKKAEGLVRVFVLWDVWAMLLLAMLEFFLVVCLGSYASNQTFPLGTLGTLSGIGSFQRLDMFDMIAWTLNTLLSITLYLYAASACLYRTGLKNHRKASIVVLGVLICPIGLLISSNYLKNIGLYTSPSAALVIMVLTFVLPLFVLIADIVKGKVAENSNANSQASH